MIDKKLTRPHILVTGLYSTKLARILTIFFAANFRITSAMFGPESMDALKKGAYDLILADLSNEKLNLMEKSRQIYALIPEREKTPTIILVDEEEKQQKIFVECQKFFTTVSLTNTVTADEILTTMKKCIPELAEKFVLQAVTSIILPEQKQG